VICAAVTSAHLQTTAALRQLSRAPADRRHGPANQLGVERVVGHHLLEPALGLRLAGETNADQAAVRGERALADLPRWSA
jgi:hypothetical protein